VTQPVRIGERLVGPGEPCFVVAEAGINHNGDVDIARKLISAAMLAGCDAVKFQKRTVEVAFTPEELATPRESPWGDTYGDEKRGLELDRDQYAAIAEYSRVQGMLWFASCWDEQAADFVEQFAPPCYKVASPSLTDDALLRHLRSFGRPLILSTGMSTIEQIDHAVELLGTNDLILMHSTSAYPAAIEELNLRVIQTLMDRYRVPVGYSGHEVGLAPTVAAAIVGACMVERHITLDRAMRGSDHAASVEPHGITRLVRDIHNVEAALGDGVKRVYDSELAKLHLRRVR
jgi:N-acetylneuraminate synthase